MPKIRGIKPDFWTDENIVELSVHARLLFIGMWNFACDNGHLQDKSKQLKMRILPTDDANCAELLREIADQGLIERVDGWITIPTLTHHQKPHKRWYVTCEKPGCELPDGASYGYSKPKSTVEQPLTNGGTTVDQPENNGGSTADVDVDVDCEVDGDGDLTTSRPLTLAEAPRADVERICERLADRIEANGAKRPTITQRWRDSARLMLDIDHRTEAEVIGAIEWSQADEFWRANILSLPKLREKYDQLRLQAQRRNGSRQESDADMFDRQMARAIEKERQMGIRS